MKLEKFNIWIRKFVFQKKVTNKNDFLFSKSFIKYDQPFRDEYAWIYPSYVQ